MQLTLYSNCVHIQVVEEHNSSYIYDLGLNRLYSQQSLEN